MFIPAWLLVAFGFLFAAAVLWIILLVSGRNPLPFPDRGSRIFTAASPEGKEVVVDLLRMHGLKERFRVDTTGVLRSILWDGTIINYPQPDLREKLGNAVASIGLVSADPPASAEAAAEFLRGRGFDARVVLDAEPELPIAFVVTNALLGTVLNFRKHVVHLPRPK